MKRYKSIVESNKKKETVTKPKEVIKNDSNIKKYKPIVK